jgi:hypothetical protein
MEIVGLHLQNVASTRLNPVERDLFGRSAFNRYYYATYLDVKECLGSLKVEWGRITHDGVPDLLMGAVKKVLQNGRERAKRASDDDTVELCSRAIHAAHELSKMMTEGYASRVAADYNPEVKIDFSDAYDFTLNFVRVKEAAGWPNKARAFLRTINSAWRQVND